MIVACINCFNDWPLIRDCVESIQDQVDRIIAVDGKYRDFPCSDWYSTDGTIEYLLSVDKVELLFCADLFESDKRNVYMEALKSGATVLVIDGDEVVEGKIKKLDRNTDIGLIKLGEPQQVRAKRIATRFFKYRKGLKHNGIHFIMEIGGKWFNNRRHALNGFKERNVNTFSINHLHRRRSRIRKIQKEEYRISARAREGQYKIASYE